MSTIRVLIVDDHPMVRNGLRSILSLYPDIVIVGEADDGLTALLAVEKFVPDVVLLDIQLPGPNGVDLVAQLTEKSPNTKIIMLTAFDNDEYLLGALAAGAFAYLLKNNPTETVVETIRLVHQGKRLLSASLIDPVLRQFHNLAQAQVRRNTDLSEEELKAMKLVADGATNEEIAKALYWSNRTAKRRVEEMIEKLGARNRAQAVALAIKKGLI